MLSETVGSLGKAELTHCYMIIWLLGIRIVHLDENYVVLGHRPGKPPGMSWAVVDLQRFALPHWCRVVAGCVVCRSRGPPVAQG